MSRRTGETHGLEAHATATDTIAAIATPPGQGAISVIRISGGSVPEVLSGCLDCDLAALAPRQAMLARIVDAERSVIDEGLLTYFPGPRSYTGEDVAEFSGHGGVLVTSKVLERFLQCGARPADPGEFSQRAFLNGKMDLTQAEAVMDVISAQTELALKSASEQLSGRLGDRLNAMREDLIGVLAHVEAFIDFPEEDIDPETGEQLSARIAAIREQAAKLLATADQGRILRQGVRTVICGAPNVGKSSLLNVLSGFERAIVSDTAGTTRDTIEEVINLRGIPLRLVDTAGMREAKDRIEAEGIERTRRQLETAELVLYVVDASLPASASGDEQAVEHTHLVRVLNKCDLGMHDDYARSEGVRFSCVAEQGRDELADAIFFRLGFSSTGSVGGSGDNIAVSVRHQQSLVRAVDFLDTARERLMAGESPEFIALELRTALQAIGEIVGRTDVEEILGEIFASFCIGK